MERWLHTCKSRSQPWLNVCLTSTKVAKKGSNHPNIIKFLFELWAQRTYLGWINNPMSSYEGEGKYACVHTTRRAHWLRTRDQCSDSNLIPHVIHQVWVLEVPVSCQIYFLMTQRQATRNWWPKEKVIMLFMVVNCENIPYCYLEIPNLYLSPHRHMKGRIGYGQCPLPPQPTHFPTRCSWNIGACDKGATLIYPPCIHQLLPPQCEPP